MDLLLQVRKWSSDCQACMIFSFSPVALCIALLQAHWHDLLLLASWLGDVGMKSERLQKPCSVVLLNALSLGYPIPRALYPRFELKI